MKTSTLNGNGQIIIPSKLRKRYGLKNGSKVGFIESGSNVILQPLNKEYFQSLIGIAGTKGKALKSLLEEKTKERY